ncbi:MAG: TRAP transporter large permease subunit [Limisphaerales bacterium]
MSDAPAQSNPQKTENEVAEPNGWQRALSILRSGENGILVLILAALVALPLVEALLRQFETGIPGASIIVQHFTLIVGMLGGAVAARDNRLLSMSALPTFLSGKTKRMAIFVGFSIAAAITFVMFDGSLAFVRDAMGMDDMLLGKFPRWIMQAFIPFGFGLVAVRIWLHSAEHWQGRLGSLAVIGLCFWLWNNPPGGMDSVRRSYAEYMQRTDAMQEAFIDDKVVGTAEELWLLSESLEREFEKQLGAEKFGAMLSEDTADPRWDGTAFAETLSEDQLKEISLVEGAAAEFMWSEEATAPLPSAVIWLALIVLVVATILGAPVFVTLGGAAAILFWGSRGGPITADGLSTIASLTIDQYDLNTNPTLPAVPLFTLAGYFLAEGGASKRLVRVFQGLIGWFRGGSAIMTCFVCAFFTTFTGASGVTILALGGLLLPVLISSKLTERHALGFVTSAGALGSLFPPCLTLILYSIRSENVTIQEIFLGGLLPGLVLVGAMAALGIWLAGRDQVEKQKFDSSEAGTAIWEAKWELLLPVVALVGLFGGFATPVETAAMTACYAFIIETFVYRDLKFTKDVPRVMTECGLVVGGVLLILGVALGVTNYLVDVEAADRALDWARENLNNKYVFLLVLNIFLIAVGCIMDVYSAIIIVVPLMVPMGEAFGIHPVHLGVIFLANLELGYITPPVGMNLFLASYRFGKPLTEVYRSILPMLAVRIVGVALITYVPIMSTALPDWLGPPERVTEEDPLDGLGDLEAMDLTDPNDNL